MITYGDIMVNLHVLYIIGLNPIKYLDYFKKIPSLN